MAKPLDLPSKHFPTKTAAREFFSEMLSRYDDGDEISDEDGELLFELLQRHPEVESKLGASGVRRFYKDRTEMSTSGFFLERYDGSVTDFSLKTCIEGRSPTQEQEFSQACREAVSKKLIAQKSELFSEAGGTLRCAVTGELVTISESEYQHDTPTFKELVESFIEANQIDISSVEISRSRDMQFIASFIDPNVSESFRSFHDANAKMIVTKKFLRRTAKEI